MKKRFKDFIPLWRFIKEDRRKFIIFNIGLFLSSFAFLFTGYLNGSAVEYITKHDLSKAILFFVIYFSMELIIDSCFGIYSRKGLEKIENKASRKISYETYNKVLNLPAVAFEEKTSGEIINRITQDADTLSFVFGRIIRIIAGFISTTVIFFYILLHSYIIALEIIVALFFMILLLRYYNPRLKKAHKERKAKQDKQTSLITESVRGIREIKTLGIKKSLLKDAKNNVKEIYDASNKEITLNRNFGITTSFLRTVLEVGSFITAGIECYYGHVSLTFFIAMTYYIYRYTWLIEEIEDFTIEYQKLKVALGRVNEILENRLYEDVNYGFKDLKNVKGVLEFRDVCFGYPNEDLTLKGFNLILKPNRKIAIVGKSGQGKSTLFNLVTRIFDVNKGEILLDDVNIKDLTESSLNKNISIIRQEPFIFNRTIKENFELINERITLSEIRKYAKMAYLDDYIMSLPKKYNTILGEGGVNLSGGQKQRLAIARTLAKKSKVILFDEATSALDNNSQEYIKKSIDNLVVDHTVVVVAHRLSTIIDADEIYVVDHGKIVDSGTHEELLQKSKIYNKLYLSENSDSN